MSKQWNDVLEREIGKTGSLGGKIGGGIAGALGGSIGARFATRFLPTEQCHQQIRVSRDVATVLTQLCSFLATHGRLADHSEAGTSPFPSIFSVIGSGFLSMNPTIVHVEVLDADEGSCLLQVNGAAKEGLIKQRSAEKAVCRVVEFLKTIG